MLLRDLKLEPREAERYFDECWLRLSDREKLHVQLAIGPEAQYGAGLPAQGDIPSIFELLAVVDYFVQKYGTNPPE